MPGIRTSTPAMPSYDGKALLDLGVERGRMTSDSRTLKPGDTFVAYPGEHQDGRAFIPQAIAAGAAAVLWDSEGFAWDNNWQIPNLGILGLRSQAGIIAGEILGWPSSHMWMVGITGTNGKTSCSHWLAQAFTAVGKKTAIVGTLGNGFYGDLAPSANTTPDSIELEYLLKDYLDQKAECVAMEVSSHGLDQGRVNGIAFDVAVLTNLSRDHLDYHGDMDSYAAAKAGLFDWPTLKHAILNVDDEFGRAMAVRTKTDGFNAIGYGFDGGEVRGSNLIVGVGGMAFDIHTPWGSDHFKSGMVGRFNASNLLATLSVLLVSGIEFNIAMQVLRTLNPVPGRMEQVREPGRALVVVDYAHTPDALEKVLDTLREMTVHKKSRLICVFGCGGGRDKGKRPIMGKIASQLADQVVVTSDNPRNEQPRDIIDDIVSGMGANYHIIEDRAAAIDYAINHAQPDDVVLIAGKGHEPYQEIDGVRFPFSDGEVACRVMKGVRS